MFKKILKVSALVAVVGLLLAGCSTGNSNDSTDSDSTATIANDTSNIGFEADTPSFFQSSTLTNGGWFKGQNLYDNFGTATLTNDVAHNAPFIYAGSRAVKSNISLAYYSGSGCGGATLLQIGCGAGTSGVLGKVPGTFAEPGSNSYRTSDTNDTTKYVIDNSGKTMSWSFALMVPVGSTVDKVMFALGDQGYNTLQSKEQDITPGTWAHYVFNVTGASASTSLLDDTSVSPTQKRPALIETVSGDASVPGVNYCGANFDPSTVRFFIIRLRSSTGTTSTTTDFYIDAIHWQ